MAYSDQLLEERSLKHCADVSISKFFQKSAS
jgi:hypothetical protein